MSNIEFTPEEQTLIDRLHNAPQPQLTAQKFQAIQQMLMQELDMPSRPVQRTRPPISKGIVITIVVAVLLLVILAVISSRQQVIEPPTATAAPTEEVNGTDSIVVIEGAVQAINGNTIRIFDTDIVIDSDNPALALIEIGKSVRIEGYSEMRDNIVVIIAVDVSVEQPLSTLPPSCKITKKGHMRCSKKK